MKFISQIVWLMILTWCLVAQLYFIAIPLALWYVATHRGYELIVVALMVDGYYQAFYSVPILSIGTVIAVYVVDIIKPQLLMYTGDNEVVS